MKKLRFRGVFYILILSYVYLNFWKIRRKNSCKSFSAQQLHWFLYWAPHFHILRMSSCRYRSLCAEVLRKAFPVRYRMRGEALASYPPYICLVSVSVPIKTPHTKKWPLLIAIKNIVWYNLQKYCPRYWSKMQGVIIWLVVFSVTGMQRAWRKKNYIMQSNCLLIMG